MKRGLFGKLDASAINVGIALTALRINLMRSILTTVGVMIGVFAVTLAVAVGSGAQVSVMESINALGSNMAIVFPEPVRKVAAAPSTAAGSPCATRG